MMSMMVVTGTYSSASRVATVWRMVWGVKLYFSPRSRCALWNCVLILR